MGVVSSILEQRCHITDLMHCIHSNDICLLKRKIKYVEDTDAMLIFLEVIHSERKQFFDFLLEKFNILSKDVCVHIGTSYYEQCFSTSVKCASPYYAMKLLEVYDLIPIYKRSALLHEAVTVENEYISHQLILKGTDVNAFDILGQTPLDNAIKCNNMDLVCMLLYYGAYTNHLPDNLTSFMYSIICQCSKAIQNILIEYEADFNLTCNGNSILFYAIKYKSPVTLEIIERGADVHFHNELYNTITIAMNYNCDTNIFRKIWGKFDVWKVPYQKSVLMMFLEIGTTATKWLEYLDIYMENETQLQLDLEFHNNSHFHYYPIISMFYLQCLERKGIDETKTESYVFHLLSHGAHIFREDIDNIYETLGVVTPFLELLLYMDLQGRDFYNTTMYFKYTPIPDIKSFLGEINFYAPVPDVREIVPLFVSDVAVLLKYLRRYYAFDGNLKMQIMDKLSPKEADYEACKRVIDESVTFPSLLQLSRDSARQWICLKYGVNNSCKLYTVIIYLNLPNYIKNILCFNICLYYFP